MKRNMWLLIFFYVVGISNERCTAQSWTQLNFMRYGDGSTYSQNPTFSTIDNSTVLLNFGLNVFVSNDSGNSFTTVDIPIKRTFYGSMSPIVTSTDVLYIESVDGPSPKYYWTLRSIDRGKSWTTLKFNGDPYHFNGVWIANKDFIAMGLPPDSNFLYKALFSTDRGETWGSDSVPLFYEDPDFSSLIGTTKVRLFAEASTSCIYQLVPSGARETRDGGRSWNTSPVPQGTFRFWYLSPSTILALQAGANESVLCKKSADTGATWIIIDSLRFVNSDTVLPAGRMQIVRQDTDGTFTFRIEGGCIVSTTDQGTTWILRGITPRNQQNEECQFYSNVQQGSTCSIQTRMYTIPPGASAPVASVQSLSGRRILIGDSTMISIDTRAVFKSTDRGRSWYGIDEELKGYSGRFLRDDPGIQPYEGHRLWWTSNQQLRSLAKYDQLIFDTDGTFLRETSFLLTKNSSVLNSKWYTTWATDTRIFTSLKKYLPISESNTLSSANDTPSPWVAAVVTSAHDIPSVKFFNDTSQKQTVYKRKDAHFVWARKNGVLLLVADSLLFSVDSAASFSSTLSIGLPRQTNGSVAIVTSMCEDNKGTLFAGLSGRIVRADTGLIEQEPGGVWKSTNGGTSWSPVAEFPAHTHVLNIACDGAARLYATTTQRTLTLGVNDKNSNQDYGADVYLVRNDSAIKTFGEFLSGPTPPGNRVLRRDQQGAMLCATMNSGLLRTTNAGKNWTKVGGDELDTVRINDVVVGRNNELYIGTTRGVMYSNAFATSVEETQGDDDDMSRRTTVWCYPTPTTSTLRIRLNNMDLLQGTRPRLTIMTLMGEEAMDLTDQAVRSLGSQRTEFDLDVSALPRGVYGLALQAGKNSSFMKLLISGH